MSEEIARILGKKVEPIKTILHDKIWSARRLSYCITITKELGFNWKCFDDIELISEGNEGSLEHACHESNNVAMDHYHAERSWFIDK